jgi:hypothetical protein
MTRRPEHAADCPGCQTGWVDGTMLCPRCTQAVQSSAPDLYPAWLKARAAEVKATYNLPPRDQAEHNIMENEAFTRGLIVGTAMALHRPKGNRREWQYQITPKGEQILSEAKKGAKP